MAECHSRELAGCPSLQSQVDIAPQAANLGRVRRVPGQRTLLLLELFNHFSFYIFMCFTLALIFCQCGRYRQPGKIKPTDRDMHTVVHDLNKCAE